MKNRSLKYRLEKTITFEASHVLEGMPEGHKCGRVHGHSYEVTVTLTSNTLDGAGMVLDTGAIAYVRDALDHRHLNDVIKINPTAENLARWVYESMNKVILVADAQDDVVVERVRVAETRSAWVEVVAVDEDES